MEHYAGIDVSLESASLCVVGATARRAPANASWHGMACCLPPTDLAWLVGGGFEAVNGRRSRQAAVPGCANSRRSAPASRAAASAVVVVATVVAIVNRDDRVIISVIEVFRGGRLVIVVVGVINTREATGI